jgi:hypothetical protein
MVLVATAAQAHPLHTTITEIAFSDGAFRTTIRVFADDFGRAVAGLGPGAPAPASVDDAAAAAYVRSHFAVTGPDGRPVVLRWCGMERREGVYLLCVGGALGRLDGAMIHDRLQWELYPDQVNIVQASYAGRRETLLFTRNDPPRRLPAT